METSNLIFIIVFCIASIASTQLYRVVQKEYNKKFYLIFSYIISLYDVMCWFEKHPEYLPINYIRVVSSNPAGRKRMEVVINKLYGNL